MLLWSWQSLLLIVAMVIVARVFRFRSAADRYAFWLIGVVAVAALPLANGFVRTLPPVKIAVLSAPDVARSIDIPSVPSMPVSPERSVTIAGTPSRIRTGQPHLVAPDRRSSFVCLVVRRSCHLPVSTLSFLVAVATSPPHGSALPNRIPTGAGRIFRATVHAPGHDGHTPSDDSLARRYSRLGYSRGAARCSAARTGACGKAGPHRQSLSNAGRSSSLLSPRGAVRTPTAGAGTRVGVR